MKTPTKSVKRSTAPTFIFNAPVTIHNIQGTHHSTIHIDSAKENKPSIWRQLLKAIPILGVILTWFKGTG